MEVTTYFKDPKATKAKKHKKRTKAEEEYLWRVKMLPCCAIMEVIEKKIIRCGDWPCDSHHIREVGTGMGIKSSDFEAIPLCKFHHQGEGGFHTLGRKKWENYFGTQREHVKQTQEELGYEADGV